MSWLQDAAYKSGSFIGSIVKGLKDTASSKGDEPAAKAKGLLVDPLDANQYEAGYQRRPSSLTYGMIRSIAHRVPLLNSVLLTRVNQVAAFGKLPENEYDIGFRVRLRDRSKPSAGALKKIEQIQNFLLFCGDHTQDRLLTHQTFQQFLRAVVRDSLLYDQLNFQVVPKVNGNPYELIAMPAHSLRLIKPGVKKGPMYDKLNRPNLKNSIIKDQTPDDTFAVQIYENMPIAEFSRRELAWGVRNPRTDIDMNGYGLSEVEIMVHTLTHLLNAQHYNGRFFSQGTAVKGILNFRGAVPERQLREFRREWHALLTGVENAFRTPVTNAEDLQWISMHESNRDMEFGEWINFLIKIICSIYQIDPIEINFQFGNTGQSSSLNQGSQEWKVRQSRARGLRPLLTMISELLTKHVAMSFDPDFEVVFVGLDAQDEKSKLDLAKTYSSSIMTVDEVRDQLYELEPLPDGKGEVVLNPQYLQHAGAIDANKEDEDGEDDFGDDFWSTDPDGQGEGDEPPEGGDEPPEGDEAPPEGDDEQAEKSVSEDEGLIKAENENLKTFEITI